MSQQTHTSIRRRRVGRRHALVACLFAAASWGAGEVLAQTVTCTGPADQVTAVADTSSGKQITQRFQFDNPPLQPLLSATIKTTGECLVAHVSGLTRVTDNYVAYQVSVDGVPMIAGQHLTGLASPDTPVTTVSIDSLSAAPFNDEQFIDPTKVSAFTFFTPVKPGVHRVTVSAGAGSGVNPANPPTVHNLVLTLTYH